jgi:tRNA threonylcarbamoyladenosine biosynthesis protein TsaB
MSIKLTYIFLKTLQIVKNISIFAVDGFYFNQNSPIKALRNRFFVKENGTITIKKAKSSNNFELPKKLFFKDFSKDIEPLYILNAV